MSTDIQAQKTSTEADRSLDAWVAFLRAHSAITRQLSAELLRRHGLTLNDYEVLLHLSRAEDQRLRRVDLAQSILLTASGITRLLDGLERAGLVCKETCKSDARVSYAKLTPTGVARLREARGGHLEDIDDLFLGRYSELELATLAELLSRLPMAGSAPAEASCG